MSSPSTGAGGAWLSGSAGGTGAGATSGSVGASSSGGAEGDLRYTYQRVQCYLAAPATECLPPTEASLPLLGDVIYGAYGYVPTAVTGFDRSYEFPASCQPLLTECCDGLAGEFQRAHCYDLADLEPPGGGFEPGCPALAAQLREFQYCPGDFQLDGEGHGAGGESAGTDELAARSLCCYFTNGMTASH
jgi:hypothetical protein